MQSLSADCSYREDAQTLEIAVAMHKARQSAASSGIISFADTFIPFQGSKEDEFWKLESEQRRLIVSICKSCELSDLLYLMP